MAVIGIGIDAVAIDRMRRATNGPGRGLRFRERVFTERERSFCEARRDPAECFAARFAAKEAVMKALGAEGIAMAFRDIEVVRAGSGAPRIELHGRVAERARALGADAIHITLTHAEPLALASVVVENIER
ncbi:MAG TPA: holo-ACP synthase [Candidatus Binatia bacterium]